MGLSRREIIEKMVFNVPYRVESINNPSWLKMVLCPALKHFNTYLGNMGKHGSFELNQP